MNSKKWLPAEDDLLVRMWSVLKKQKDCFEKLASRFSCTPDEARQRLEALRSHANGADVASNSKALPSDKEVEEAMQCLNDLQAAFTKAAVAFNVLGEQMKVCAEFMAATLQQPEMVDAMQGALDASRCTDETTAEKLARVVAEQYIVIPKHVTTDPAPGQEQQAGGASS